MKKKLTFHRITAWTRAFLIVALVFLAVGLGTLGSFASTGDAYMLTYRQEQDGKEPCMIVHITDPDVGHGEEGHVHRDLYVQEVYVNIGAIYDEPGKVVTLTVARGTSAGSSYYNSEGIKLSNLYEKVEEGGKSVSPLNALGNWARYQVTTTNGWRISTYPYYKITVDSSNVLINEIVFVANDRDGTGDPVVVNATVNNLSVLPYDKDAGETIETAVARAQAVFDSQRLPAQAQSSFYRFGEEELYTLMTVAEMRQGNSYSVYNNGKYNLDTVYNAFGTDLIALGADIFGMSPFGLRFLPFLASFGVLVFGFLFVKEVTKSDKAGFAFALLYALCGMSFSLGHFATPLMIGVFFFVAALYFAYRYYEGEAGGPTVLSALLSGLFSAAAVCVNGAFLIPVAGLAGLVIAGLIGHRKRGQALLDTAVDEAEKEEEAKAKESAAPQAQEEVQPSVSEGRKKVAATLQENHKKTVVAPAMFFAFFVLGAFLIAMLSVLPMYFTYVKLYDNPTDPQGSVFYFLWKGFAGGFAGGNALSSNQSAWTPFYVLFRGTGERYAVTAGGLLVSVAALAAGLFGVVYTIVALFRRVDADNFGGTLRRALVLFFGTVLSFVTSAFAQGGLAFLLLGEIFLFALAANALCDWEKTGGKYALVLDRVAIAYAVVLAVCFGLFAAFTFSIPTAGFMAGLYA